MKFLFWRFIDPSAHIHHGMHHEFNIPLVVLSILNAMMASYVAFTIIDRVKSITDPKQKKTFLLIGSMAMGFGVWAMHFTAMQACSIGIEVSYDMPLTFISVLPAMAGAFFALRTMASEVAVSWQRIQLNALYMAAGIGTMHYTGMEAIRAKALMGYDISMFIFSIVAAHVFAMLSLRAKKIRLIAFGNSGLIKNISCAFIMGIAVSCMHYTAMYAVHFYPDESITLSSSSINLPPVVFGSILFMAVLVILSAVTVSVLVEQAFSSNRQLLQTVLSVSPAGVLAVDKRGKIRSINNAGKDIFGLLEGDIFEPNKIIVNNDTVEDLERKVDKKPIIYHDTNMSRSDGSTFPAQVMIAKVAFDSDQIIVVMINDLTELKEAESQLMQNSKMVSLGKMASGLAHEINTPLGTIIMRSSQIMRLIDVSNFNKDKVKEFTTAISHAGKHIESIIKGLRSFSRSGENDPFSPVTVSDLIGDTLTLCSASMENHGIEIIINDFDKNLLVECRKSQICQILLNILENAKYAVIENGKSEKTIRIDVFEDMNTLQIRLSDNGKGIPPDAREHILEPFFTTKDVGKGTGLGLSISKGIAEDHFGRIYLDTQESDTTFVLEIPKVHEEPKVAA